MEIILKASVENLGSIGDIVKVKDGYGRNYLIPQGLATVATTARKNQFETEREGLVKKAAKLRGDADALKESLEGLKLNFIRKAGEEDKLFGAVTTMDLEEAINKEDYAIEKRKILLDEPIKALGEYDFRVKIHPEVIANMKVTVEKE